MSEERMPPSTRLNKLIQMLRNRGYTIRELMERLGTTRRTIYRDLERLRNDMQVPLEPQDGLYRIESRDVMPTLALTESELVALFLACTTLQKNGTLPDEALSALDKLRASAQASPRRSLETLEEAIEVAPGRGGKSFMADLLKAYSEERVVHLLYHSRERNEPVWRRYELWGLFFFQDMWYLVGHDHLSGQQRTFRMDRIKALEVLDETYQRPQDFEPGSAMFHRFDLGEGGPTRVRIRVEPEIARHLEETPGHHSQRVNGAEVEFQVKAPLRMGQWLLGLGGVEVLEPAELRAEVARQARAMAERNAP